MRSIKGVYKSGQLTLDEPVLTQQPVEVMVVFGDEPVVDGSKRKFSLNARWRGIDPDETFRREDYVRP